MKKNLFFSLLLMAGLMLAAGCGEGTSAGGDVQGAPEGAGQSAVQDDDSEKDVVKVAVGSKDHTTLVAAVKAADLVNVLSNAGPFTVFAPTNAAFDALPAGTVETLLKPENLEKLQEVLQYHVYVGGISKENMRDGQVLNQVSGQNITLHVNGGDVTINDNGAKIIASVKASNGIVHVIDKVLLAPTK